MKKLVIITFICLAFSCKKETEQNSSQSKTDETSKNISGKELFENKGTCTACHLPEQKVIGPSITEIAKMYKEKNASIVSFLKEETEPIVDPKMYETMKANFAITKQMSDDELKALEDYILTFAK